MITGEFNEIRWLAVLLAAIVSFVLGGLWFAPFAFGKLYHQALGFKVPAHWKPGAQYYIGPFVGNVAMTIVTALLLRATDVRSFGQAIALGLVVGIGYAAAVSCVNAITPTMPKPQLFGAITGAYHTLSITLAAVILYALR